MDPVDEFCSIVGLKSKNRDCAISSMVFCHIGWKKSILVQTSTISTKLYPSWEVLSWKRSKEMWSHGSEARMGWRGWNPVLEIVYCWHAAHSWNWPKILSEREKAPQSIMNMNMVDDLDGSLVFGYDARCALHTRHRVFHVRWILNESASIRSYWKEKNSLWWFSCHFIPTLLCYGGRILK